MGLLPCSGILDLVPFLHIRPTPGGNRTEFDAEAVRDLHAVKGRTAIWTEKNKTMLVLQSMVLLFFLPVIADHSVHYIDWLSLKKGPQIIHSNVHQTLAAFLWRPGNMRRNDTILRF